MCCVILFCVLKHLLGQIHLIAFMITSNETNEDFSFFLSGLVSVCKELDLEFDPQWTMQDAQLSCKQAVEDVCENTIVLMCYYHVMSNIKKYKLSNKSLVSDKDFEEIQKDIQQLHLSLNEKEYENGKKSFITKWSKRSSHIYNYIDQQWFNGEFTNWQVYHNPPGFANTNSNIESVNNDFKRFFTNRKRLSMKGAIEIIGKCIIYNSENLKVFETKPKLSRRLLTTANSIPKSRFTKVSQSSVKYINDDTEYIIKFKNEPSCQCFLYLKKAICPHLISYSHLHGLQWYGSKMDRWMDDQMNLVPKVKRGAKGGAFHKAQKALIKK